MKFRFFLSGLMISVLGFAACEKDDLCSEDTPTTPLIYIKFYNVDDQNQPNSQGFVMAQAIGFQDSIMRSGNELKLPLQLNANETSWILKLETRDEQNNEIIAYDTLTFKYQPLTEYVNKACGYKTMFVLDEKNTMPIINGNENTKQGHWIRTYELVTSYIDNDYEEHIKIFY